MNVPLTELTYVGLENGRRAWQCAACGDWNYEIEATCGKCFRTPQQAEEFAAEQVRRELGTESEPERKPAQGSLFQ